MAAHAIGIESAHSPAELWTQARALFQVALPARPSGSVRVLARSPTTSWGAIWNMTAEEARLPIPLRLPAPLTLPPAVDAPAPFATAYAEAASWRTSSRPCHFCQPSRRHAAGERAPPMVTAAGYGVQSRWAPTLGGGGIYGVQNNTMKFSWFTVWCTSIIRGATTCLPFQLLQCPIVPAPRWDQ